MIFMEDCIFCQIIKKEVPAKIIYESGNIVVFPDISPGADVHLLIVPKEHIKEMKDLKNGYGELLSEVFLVSEQLVLENNLEDNVYRVVINGGSAQHIPHLHFHFLGGNWWKRE